MIVGIGTDIIEIERLVKSLERHGTHFLERVFTPLEIRSAPKNANEYFAGRWAAKEAVSKALGTGLGADCAWTDIEVRRDEQSGRPFVCICGAAAETASRLGITRWHISISHERSYATAFVVAEA